MDDLELPSNRAHLFEVIDADGSGTLHIQELVQGLLKLRGEARPVRVGMSWAIVGPSQGD